jgi:lipid-A-disaccharide synthase
MGGDLMHAVSEGQVMHYKETNYMMLDVLFHLRKILRNMERIRQEISRWGPDVVIPVDYPGFNLRMARYAAGRGIRVFYFISPKVWAWKKGRIRRMKKYLSRLFVILPFEVDFFRSHAMEVEFFGNPLVDAVDEFRKEFTGAEQWKEARGFDRRPVVALLAGSRRKEIEHMLPAMARVASMHPGQQFVVAGAPAIPREFYASYLEGGDLRIVHGETYALLASASAAMVTSGTATLETALFGIPQVVMYRTGALAYALAKRIVNVNFISLVNLILGRELLKEVIQKDLQECAGRELDRILNEEAHRERILAGYGEMRDMLGETGVVHRIASRMVQLLTEHKE